MPPLPEGSRDLLQTVRTSKCAIVAKSRDDDFKKIFELLKSCDQTPAVIEVNSKGSTAEALDTLYKITGRSNLPLVFVKGDCVGDFSDLTRYEQSGGLKESFQDHEYDLIVLGGGSGGLAAGKEAARLGKKVAVLDFVKPTPIGTTWGLGGTCVNVGCIPKKLMHQGALLGKALKDSKAYGWNYGEEPSHSWEKMKDAIQDHIGTLNWNYRVQLRENNVTYLNAYGSFVGSHKIKAVNKRGKEQFLTADKILISTGLRPRYLNTPGAKEYCITSDDLFSLPYNPGKTLLVGASYVSLECAGFLNGIGLDATVMVRSILLRGFDQDMAERIGSIHKSRKHMEECGIKFIREAVPTKIELIQEGKPGKIKVTAKANDGTEIIDEYNTVVLAIGRDAVTDNLGFELGGIERNEKNKKVKGINEQSASAPHVYAIGDVLDGKPELTPVAIHAGRFLMRRLYGDSAYMTDYENVPTTVFTPLEYGACGLSEEDAIARFGDNNVEVFHNNYQPLEYTVPARDLSHCYVKLICNKSDDMRILGLHILGPNAGEITQGFGMAFVLNATKADFDKLIGIHPTCAEVKMGFFFGYADAA